VDRCYLCKRDEESVDHLLLHCDVVSTLWNLVFSRFGMSWVMSRRVIDLFVCWYKAGRPRSAAVWKMVPICIFWCVWKERNLRCFEDMRIPWRILLPRSFSIFGRWSLCHPCLLAILIFLLVFLCLFRHFLVYTSSVLRGALRF
jgi:hypothetical protein